MIPIRMNFPLLMKGVVARLKQAIDAAHSF
jgi:hypothetical protein